MLKISLYIYNKSGYNKKLKKKKRTRKFVKEFGIRIKSIIYSSHEVLYLLKRKIEKVNESFTRSIFEDEFFRGIIGNKVSEVTHS